MGPEDKNVVLLRRQIPHFENEYGCIYTYSYIQKQFRQFIIEISSFLGINFCGDFCSL